MPASTIYLVRHAESEHNVTKDFSTRDPGLTELGFTQASALATDSVFPALSSVGVIVSSPLRRTIETTLAGFRDIIEGGGAKLILDPDLQERSELPCDTGSSVGELTERFPGLDFSELERGDGDGWFAKKGRYTGDDDAVTARAADVRKRLWGIVNGLERSEADEKKDVVVVTHGVFMKFLSQDETIDLPKAGWKAYRVEAGEGKDEEGAVLIAV